MFTRVSLLLGITMALALLLHQTLFAQDNPRVSYTRAGFSVAIEGNANATMDFTAEQDKQISICKGELTLSATINGQAKGQPLYDISGKARLITYTGQKTSGTLRLEKVKDMAPSLVIVNRATKEKRTLTGDVIEYRLHDNTLDVRGNARLESPAESMVITCQLLHAASNANKTIEAVIANGDVVFTGVVKAQKEGDVSRRIDGKAGMLTYLPPPEQTSAGSGIMRLEKGPKGPLPNMVITDLSTMEQEGSIQGSPLNVKLKPFEFTLGNPITEGDKP